MAERARQRWAELEVPRRLGRCQRCRNKAEPSRGLTVCRRCRRAETRCRERRVYHDRMPSLDPVIASTATRVLTLPQVRGWMRRMWYRLCHRCALRKFRSLAPRVEGLLEQRDCDGTVNRDALGQLAAQLDALSVYPRAVRYERGEDHLRDELVYLRHCMEAPPNCPLLHVARKVFSAGSLRDLDFDHDVLSDGEEA